MAIVRVTPAMLTLLLVSLCCHVTVGEICMTSSCYYEFSLNHEKTMVYRRVDATGQIQAYDVEINNGTLFTVFNSYHTGFGDNFVGSAVSADDVITGDGYPRQVITINGQFPGPTIEVMQGAEVTIKVTNNLYLQSATIHWHGIVQRGTPSSDGVAYVTQCPILPKQSFTYRFTVTQVGTFWYHSHLANQRADGMLGFFIIHPAPPPEPYFPVILAEWYHEDAIDTSVEEVKSSPYPGPGDTAVLNPPYTMADGNINSLERFVGGLVNGRGRFKDYPTAPLTSFVVTAGQRQRFRVVNGGLQHPLRVEIDGHHSLEIVALDGPSVEPIFVDSFIVMPGERLDFYLTADQTPGSYWMRAYTLITSRNDLPQILAIVRYSGTPEGDPTSTQTDCTTKPGGCSVFNCMIGAFVESAGINCVHVTSAASTRAGTQDFINEFGLWKKDPDMEFFLNLGFYHGASINGISDAGVTSAFISRHTNSAGFTPCPETCPKEGCICSNAINLPFNQVIQVVFTTFDIPGPSGLILPHPAHIHGHDFVVLKHGYQPINETTGLGYGRNADVMCADPNCFNAMWSGERPEVNLVNPPVKDTVEVPGNGYVVVRFISNNPGPWLVHCHFDSHSMLGMTIVFNEAETLQPPVPVGFPTCGDYVPN